jgi:tetratricopeptide (TPR) repeat protein
MAEVLIDQGQYDAAIDKAIEGLKIDHPQVGSEINSVLARAYLSKGMLPEAYDAAETAMHYDFLENYHYVLVLLGLIIMRQEVLDKAIIILEKACNHADELLTKDVRNMQAWDTKSLALAGLVLCKKDHSYVLEAKHAYDAARKINDEDGVVIRMRNLFKILTTAPGYDDEIISEIRQIILREE